MSLPARMQATSAEYQKLQADLSAVVDARGRLDAQLTENESVQKEFGKLSSQNEVFKLVGPVLIKQDQAEAKSNIAKRLEFIRSEISRVEGQIKEMEGKSDSKRAELGEMQTALEAQNKQQKAIA